jgi:hypothetical protein
MNQSGYILGYMHRTASMVKEASLEKEAVLPLAALIMPALTAAGAVSTGVDAKKTYQAFKDNDPNKWKKLGWTGIGAAGTMVGGSWAIKSLGAGMKYARIAGKLNQKAQALKAAGKVKEAEALTAKIPHIMQKAKAMKQGAAAANQAQRQHDALMHMAQAAGPKSKEGREAFRAAQQLKSKMGRGVVEGGTRVTKDGKTISWGILSPEQAAKNIGAMAGTPAQKAYQAQMQVAGTLKGADRANALMKAKSMYEALPKAQQSFGAEAQQSLMQAGNMLQRGVGAVGSAISSATPQFIKSTGKAVASGAGKLNRSAADVTARMAPGQMARLGTVAGKNGGRVNLAAAFQHSRLNAPARFMSKHWLPLMAAESVVAPKILGKREDLQMKSSSKPITTGKMLTEIGQGNFPTSIEDNEMLSALGNQMGQWGG